MTVTCVTDDDVAAGAERDQKPGLRKLSSGFELKGLKATVKGPGADDFQVIDVMTKGDAKGGIVVITLIDTASAAHDQPVIDGFWSSLSVK